MEDCTDDHHKLQSRKLCIIQVVCHTCTHAEITMTVLFSKYRIMFQYMPLACLHSSTRGQKKQENPHMGFILSLVLRQKKEPKHIRNYIHNTIKDEAQLLVSFDS